MSTASVWLYQNNFVLENEIKYLKTFTLFTKNIIFAVVFNSISGTEITYFTCKYLQKQQQK